MLIETKLRPPELRGCLIERPALERQLDLAGAAKLTILSAPAGFGKTTLLCQWIDRQQQRGISCGWLSLDAADNEIGRFIGYMVGALQRVDPALAGTVSALLRASPVLPVDSVLTQLVNDLGRRAQPLRLVLDDCHVLTSPEIGQFLDALLTYAPGKFHLVLATRGQIPLRVANMRVRGQMTRIDDMSLRFSLAETDVFLNTLRGLALPEEDVVTLQHRTEGWIAALQLAALSLEDRSDRAEFIRRFSGTDRDIADFLLHDVLARLSDSTINFLLKTSILGRISAPLAQAVTEQQDAAQLLADLERANLFLIPLDRDRIWYRYHQLFADLLVSLLIRRHPDGIAVLHRKAVRWLTENGFTSDAVHHALQAGDTAQAAALVESCCMPLIRQGHIARVREWLSSLPQAVIDRRPRLQLAQVWILFHVSQPMRAARILKAARDNIDAMAQDGGLSLAERQEFKAELFTLTAGVISAADRSATAAHLARSWLEGFPEGQHFSKGTLNNILAFCLYSLGDLDGARLACQRGRASHERAQSVLGIVYSDLILGLAEQAGGNLKTSHRLFESAIRYARAELGSGSYAEAMVAIFEVELLYEWNDLDAASRLLQQHRHLVEECGLVVHEMACKLSLAKLAASQGRLDEALGVLEQAERQGLRDRYRRLFASALDERVRLLLQRGDIAAAKLVLRIHGIDEAWVSSPATRRPACEPEHIALARLLVADGRPEAAFRILENLAGRLRHDGRLRRLAQVKALASIAAFQAGDALGALAAIADAIALSAPQNAIRGFLDEGPAFQHVLAFAQSRIPSWKAGSEAGDFVRKLAGLRPTPPAPCEVNARRGAPQFSSREADVVRLLSSGRSNRDVAHALALAPDTVKWHLKNIFGKLGVSNRTQAVLRLQELGLGARQHPTQHSPE